MTHSADMLCSFMAGACIGGLLIALILPPDVPMKHPCTAADVPRCESAFKVISSLGACHPGQKL